MTDPYDPYVSPRDEVRTRATWAALWRWLPAVLLVTVLAAAGGWVWANRSTATYTATGVVELTDDASGNTTRFVDQQEMAAQRQRLLANDTRDQLDAALGAHAATVTGLTASTDEDSTLLTIRLTSTRPDVATVALDTLIDIFVAQRVDEQVSRFADELEVAEGKVAVQQANVDEVTATLSATENSSERRALEIEQQAAVNTLQVYEQDVQNLQAEIALADGRVRVQDRPESASVNRRSKAFTAAQFGVLALLLSGGAVVALASRNSRFRLVDEIEESLPPDIPVLATVPKFRKQFRDRNSAIVIGRPDAMREAEAFRFLRTSVELATADHTTHTVAITSATPGEGKTVTSANLALSLATSGSRTLLIDGDLIAPSLPELSGRPDTVNTLPHLLSGAYTPEELITTIGSGDRSLDLLISSEVAAAGRTRIELVPETMRQTFKDLNNFYQALVIDCPPALVVSDALATCAAADFTIVVARLGQVRRRELDRTIETLLQNGANILGVIVTHVDSRGGYGYGGYGGYGG